MKKKLKESSYYGGVPAPVQKGDSPGENRGKFKPPKPGEGGTNNGVGGTDGVEDDYGGVSADSQKFAKIIAKLAGRVAKKDRPTAAVLTFLSTKVAKSFKNTNITRKDADNILNKRPVRTVAMSIPELGDLIDAVFNKISLPGGSLPAAGADTQKSVK